MTYYVYILSPGFSITSTPPAQPTLFRKLTVKEQFECVASHIRNLRSRHRNPNDLVFFLMHEYFFWQFKSKDFTTARQINRYLSYEEYKFIQQSLQELSKDQEGFTPIVILAGLAVLDSTYRRPRKTPLEQKKKHFVDHLLSISETDRCLKSFRENVGFYEFEISKKSQFDYGKNLVIVCENGHHTNIHKSIPFHEPMPYKETAWPPFREQGLFYTNYNKSFPFYRLRGKQNRLIAVEICLDHKLWVAHKAFLYRKDRDASGFFQPDDVLDFHFVLSDSIEKLEYILEEANYFIHVDIFYQRQAFIVHDDPSLMSGSLASRSGQRDISAETVIPKLAVFDINISNPETSVETEVKVTEAPSSLGRASIKWK